MKTKKEIIEIIEILKETYPEASCSLNFNSPFELVIAVMLSAQCTDERVNKTTPSLFKLYNTPEKLSQIEIAELEKIIHPCGFYKNKAKNIIECSKRLVEVYNSEVPDKMEDLITLAGIGRKSANVVMLDAFNNPQGIAVDTHAKRLSNRLGLSKNTEPEKIEQDLLKQVPKEYLKDVNHLFVYHGRNTCTSRNPRCAECPINKYCKYFSEQK